MSRFFTPYRNSAGIVRVELDLSRYAAETDLKNVTYIDVSNFALKSILANLKTDVGKTDVEKIKTVPVDLSKLSNVVKNEAVKKTVSDKLVTNVNNIDTTVFVLKTKYNTDRSDLEKKISDAEKNISYTSPLVRKQIIILKLLK